MNEYLDLCSENPLFANIPKEELLPLLGCLDAQKKAFRKGSVLFHTGERISQLGIVLEGTVLAESSDIMGNRSIILTMTPGQIFCDAYSSTKSHIILVDIAAKTNCTVLLFETRAFFGSCPGAQKYRNQLSENLIHILAQKYVDLGCKVIHLSGRSIRKKLLSYLSEQFRFSEGKPFAIPFSQQELADYLFIERSGLSTEINRLKKEGILICRNGLYSLTASTL